MSERKKKKATVAELALGGGLLALFLPVILFAFIWGVIALGIGMVFTFVSHDSATMGPVALVYGGLLAAMLFTAYRFGTRFSLLVRRWIGLIREQRRIRATTHVLTDHPDTTDDRHSSTDDAARPRRQS